MEKAAEDKREYRFIHVGKNGDLPCILVSDMESDTSAGAVTVFSGTDVDPLEHAGMMHLLEHSLFLGTEKYKAENLFREFLSQHNGHSNAYTAHDHTSYFFEVDTNHLEVALDQFSHFFINPLLNKELVLREVDAVDSEHNKNKQNDDWRFDEIISSTTNPDHPYSKFGTGTKETLKKDEVPGVMADIFRRYYTSKNMCVSVAGNKTLDELEKITKESFAEFSNLGEVKIEYSEIPVVTEKEKGRTFYIVPVADINNINVVWFQPSLIGKWKSKPDSYIAHLIGHESKGSVLYVLKEKGWATELSAGCAMNTRTFSRFDVDITLTEDGWVHREEVVDLLFSYIGYIKEKGIIERIYEEVRQLAEMKFRFKNRESVLGYAMSLSTRYGKYPLEKLLSGPILFLEFEIEYIRKTLGEMSARNASVFFISRKAKEKCKLQERWYETEYGQFRMSDAEIGRWSTLERAEGLELPATNPFIASDYAVLTAKKSEVPSMPGLAFEDKNLEIWYKQDDTFLQPKANIYVCFDSVHSYSSSKSVVLNTLFSRLLVQDSNDTAYMADCAGLAFRCREGAGCTIMQFSGYNDKMFELIQQVFSRIAKFADEITENEFNYVREQLERELTNFKFWQPYKHSNYYLLRLLQNPSWPINEQIDSVKIVTRKDIREYAPVFLSNCHVSAMIHGNLEATESVDKVQKLLKDLFPDTARNSFNDSILRRRTTEVPRGSYVMKMQCPNKDDENSSCIVYLQFGHLSVKGRVLLELLSQMVADIAFDRLRNVEQLGYIVHLIPTSTNKIDGLMILVQSSVASSGHLNSRIQSFLDGITAFIKELSDAQFDVHKDGLIATKMERFQKLNSESNFLWAKIVEESFFFEKKQRQIEVLRGLSKSDLEEFFNDNFSKENRRRVAVQIESQKTGDKNSLLDEKIEEKEIEISDIDDFKSIQRLFPSRWVEEMARLNAERQKLARMNE